MITALPLDELSAPLSEGQPCGPDLEYDAAFIALDAASHGTPERVSGNTVVAAAAPVWSEVHDAALALARRTRDLRVAVLLARAGARVRALAGYADGMSLVARLLEQHWDSVHPRLDALDGDDATMRLNALATLANGASGLLDLRACAVVAPGHPLTVRMIELAWTKADPAAGESRPTQAGLGKALQDAADKDAALLDRMTATHAAATTIDRVLRERAGNAGPDPQPLLRITQALAQAAAAAAGNAVVAANSDGAVADASSNVPAGAIRTREDAVRALGAVCDWIERHEPSHPAPLLIRRAQRLMSKSFIDLVRDLAPDGLTQLERIAGVTPN